MHAIGHQNGRLPNEKIFGNPECSASVGNDHRISPEHAHLAIDASDNLPVIEPPYVYDGDKRTRIRFQLKWGIDKSLKGHHAAGNIGRETNEDDEPTKGKKTIHTLFRGSSRRRRRLQLHRRHVNNDVLLGIVEDGPIGRKNKMVAVLRLPIEYIPLSELLHVHNRRHCRLRIHRKDEVLPHFREYLFRKFLVLCGILCLHLFQSHRYLLETLFGLPTASVEHKNECEEHNDKNAKNEFQC